MRKPNKLLILALVAISGSLVLSACGASTPEPTPTLSVEAIQTSAIATFSAGLTQTAISMPADTPTPTPAPTGTAIPTRTSGAGTPTGVCLWLTWVRDVSIPDNTVMIPGQTFTKTWLVKNTGNCAWEAGFKLIFTSGDAMGGVTLVLSSAINPDTETQLSIPMTAPNTTGTLRGSWRMADASGTFFGDYMWVIINLTGTTTTVVPTAIGGTTTPGTPTYTPTPSVTPTPTST